MNKKILCVDDDPNILQAYQRKLRKQFHIDTALGGEEALEAIRRQGPYAVVVADMRMPKMNGVELLAKIKQLAPNTVRMMLTGNADQQTALEAVNEGQIFRFMTKPCPPEVFAKVLEAGVEQYRLITAERELLSKTLAGSIKVLTDVLTLVNPQAFGRASRVRGLVGQLCNSLAPEKTWFVEIAAMLSQLGCVTVPDETLAKVYSGEELTRAEADAYESHPKIARGLLANIPRLEEVAEIIAYQEKHYNGDGFPADYVSGEKIPLGSRILKLALDWDILVSAGLSSEMALAEINDRPGRYDPKVVDMLRKNLEINEVHVVRQVQVSDLRDGTVFADDVRTIRGTLLCSKGQEVTPAIRLRLRNYVANVGLAKPVRVFVPADTAYENAAEYGIGNP